MATLPSSQLDSVQKASPPQVPDLLCEQGARVG
jgi:hypothetical protein